MILAPFFIDKNVYLLLSIESTGDKTINDGGTANERNRLDSRHRRTTWRRAWLRRTLLLQERSLPLQDHRCDGVSNHTRSHHHRRYVHEAADRTAHAQLHLRRTGPGLRAEAHQEAEAQPGHRVQRMPRRRT